MVYTRAVLGMTNNVQDIVIIDIYYRNECILLRTRKNIKNIHYKYIMYRRNDFI